MKQKLVSEFVPFHSDKTYAMNKHSLIYGYKDKLSVLESTLEAKCEVLYASNVEDPFSMYCNGLSSASFEDIVMFIQQHKEVLVNKENKKVFTKFKRLAINLSDESSYIIKNDKSILISKGDKTKIAVLGDNCLILSKDTNSSIEVFGNNCLIICGGEFSNIKIHGENSRIIGFANNCFYESHSSGNTIKAIGMNSSIALMDSNTNVFSNYSNHISYIEQSDDSILGTIKVHKVTNRNLTQYKYSDSKLSEIRGA